MILIEKNSVNRVVVTLDEKVTLTGVTYFLFEFTSDNTNEPIYFTADDVSPNTCRYNEFMITESGSTLDPLNGIINLEPNGYYKYTVYQQENPINLDPTLAQGVVETGKVFVNGEVKPIFTEFNNDDDYTYIAYE